MAEKSPRTADESPPEFMIARLINAPRALVFRTGPIPVIWPTGGGRADLRIRRANSTFA